MQISTPSNSSEDEFHREKRVKFTISANDPVSLHSTAIYEDMDSSSTDWEWLPKDILSLILDKLVYLVDYVHFGAVCKEWYRVAQENRKRRHRINAAHPHQLPLLLIPVKVNKEERLIYNVTQYRISKMKLKLPFKRYFGSSFAWLMHLEDETYCIILLNPFSNKVIKLPPIKGYDEPPYDEDYVKKAILASDPDLHPSDFMVAIIYHDMWRLGVYKSSVQSWTYMIDHPSLTTYCDVINHKGNFYAIDTLMGIGRIDTAAIGKPSWLPQISLVAPQEISVCSSMYRLYLVQTFDRDLLLIQRIYARVYPHRQYEDWEKLELFSSKFTVYKLEDSHDEKSHLVEIRDIGDNAMFLGDGYSMLVPTCGIPGLQRNCIYFLNNEYDPYIPYDAGIFSLTDGSIKPHYVLENTTELPPLVWILPTLSRD